MLSIKGAAQETREVRTAHAQISIATSFEDTRFLTQLSGFIARTISFHGQIEYEEVSSSSLDRLVDTLR
ncbi:uncharacterized protein FOMMEDRAFT_157057 [Fomitiporia mediterranea MF3/22]|uniref:uncharacterized protein n=1 Tax=Fomitiporia mediterranea (strain MF3/22) TaxID=694068 RepID=UPI000440958D|nr:uncharacterized protein FOMMEDRAFT_157057 [Fomitiporia mediterranea MF3/22]EJD01917.1 hypothetical protein FOMMEDRAFT_157057 [Fomitiporia mediterranea MF3/22]